MPESKGMGGLGGIEPKPFNPLETYFDTVRQGIGLPKRKWIVQPDWKPCEVPVPAGPHADLVRQLIQAHQQFFECHVLPRNWQMLADFFMKLQQGTYLVKNPNYHEAPITARALDLRDDDPTSIAATTPTVVIQQTIPDRHVGSVIGFGQGICLVADWNRVLWTIQVNDRPVEGYQDFRLQTGQYHDPTTLPNPIRLKGQDVLQVTARLSAAGVAADVWSRAKAFIFPVRTVTQDGSWKEYQTQM